MFLQAHRPVRHWKLKRLGFKDYPEYLRSDHWRQTRRAYWESDEPKECICGETERLQLHHLTYERLGDERLSDLTPLCQPCHAAIHVLVNRGELGLDFAGFVNAKRAERYAMERRVKEGESWDELHGDRLASQRWRSLTERWRIAYIQAAKQGVDMKPHLATIDGITEAMKAEARAA